MLLFVNIVAMKNESQDLQGMLNAIRKADISTVKKYLGAGFDVNKVDEDGHTPLHLAVRTGIAEVVELLLEKGADVNKVDKYGDTPLAVATKKDFTDIIKLLETARNKSRQPQSDKLALALVGLKEAIGQTMASIKNVQKNLDNIMMVLAKN